jgi:SPP1 family predicted phage head-tail adaptor
MKCCDLTAGKMRSVITFETPTRTPDGYGGYSVVWDAVAAITAKAMIKPISGAEVWQAYRLESNITHRIFTRYRAGITPEMRINFGGRIMQMSPPINIEERNRWFEIHAVEGKAT